MDARTGELVWHQQTMQGDVWTARNPEGPGMGFEAAPQLFDATINGERRRLVGAGQKSGVYHVFDRETGKLSDEDYRLLKEKYTAQALEALRAEQQEVAPDDVEALIAHRVRALRSAAASAPPGARVCATCGPRPEPDAVFCSTCGGSLPAPAACARCGTPLSADSRFCEGCGSRVAA